MTVKFLKEKLNHAGSQSWLEAEKTNGCVVKMVHANVATTMVFGEWCQGYFFCSVKYFAALYEEVLNARELRKRIVLFVLCISVGV